MTNSRKWALWLMGLVIALLVAAFVDGWSLVAAILAVLGALALRFVPVVVIVLLVASIKGKNSKKN
jgi:hypothetical protein